MTRFLRLWIDIVADVRASVCRWCVLDLQIHRGGYFMGFEIDDADHRSKSDAVSQYRVAAQKAAVQALLY